MPKEQKKKPQNKVTIHQFHPHVSFGDAITNHMFFIQKSLKEIGIAGEMFAHEAQKVSRSSIKPFSRRELEGCDLLLLHHSTGNLVLKKILRLKVPKILVYHNITPEVFFQHDRFIWKLLQLGRQQLSLLRNSVIASFSDSLFNAKELENYGFPKSKILPLFDSKSLFQPQGRKKPPTSPVHKLLFVGKLAPHKNQDLLIQTLYHLKRISSQKYKLVLVGGEDPVYGRYLKLLTRALKLEADVNFAGKVSQASLHSHYQSASAYVSMSLHEGFCIPLIEAMSASLPVFALASAAVPETLGGAGLEIYTKNPHQIACILDTALGNHNKEAKQWKYPALMLKSQKQRLTELKKIQAPQKVQELFSDLIQQLQL